jgi:amino acid adenylation domain-containing protein
VASYDEVIVRSNALAAALIDKGLQKGDRVALYLPRSIETVTALFGVWIAGGIAVVINDVLKKQQIAHIVQDAEATIIVTATALIKNLPAKKPWLTLLVFEEQTPSTSHRSSFPTVIGSDLAMLIYTSGSTGLPKGIMVSHDNLYSGAGIVSDYLHLNGSDTLISLLPFSFDYGLNQLLSSVFTGAKLVIQRSVLPADITQTLQGESVTGMAAVPMLWQQLCHPRSPFLKTSFPTLRYITNTGGAMPEQITRKIRAAHPHVEIYLMFGLTEAFRSTFLPPEEVDVRPTSIGKAIPNVEIFLLNEEGKRCKPGEVGELVHRGANISRGYWKQREATQRIFRSNPLSHAGESLGETVVYSGDFAKTDDQGFLYYVGRKDAQLKSHGMRVSPDEIEGYLLQSRSLAHAIVFGIPNKEGESDIVAAIVPFDIKEFQLDELKHYCKSELAEYLTPRDFLILDTLPQTSSGKPDRVRIREDYFSQKK